MFLPQHSVRNRDNRTNVVLEDLYFAVPTRLFRADNTYLKVNEVLTGIELAINKLAQAEFIIGTDHTHCVRLTGENILSCREDLKALVANYLAKFGIRPSELIGVSPDAAIGLTYRLNAYPLLPDLSLKDLFNVLCTTRYLLSGEFRLDGLSVTICLPRLGESTEIWLSTSYPREFDMLLGSLMNSLDLMFTGQSALATILPQDVSPTSVSFVGSFSRER